jgi:phage baseplate assembly protein W
MNFLGTPYPITKNTMGYFRTQTDLATIKSDLLILLLTNPGERVFLPDYGTPLKRLVFEQNDSILEQEVKNTIINSINKWEPRITVQSIEVVKPSRENLNKDDALQDLDNILYVKIRFFDPEQISNVQELKLEIPLS